MLHFVQSQALNLCGLHVKQPPPLELGDLAVKARTAGLKRLLGLETLLMARTAFEDAHLRCGPSLTYQQLTPCTHIAGHY